jgi:uncharacterized membrane protein YkgB
MKKSPRGRGTEKQGEAVAKVITRLDRVDAAITRWMAGHGVTLLRVAMGIVFFWFGALKFFPGMSPAEALAGRTIETLTLGWVPPTVSLPGLAIWECLIGLGFLSGKFLRVTILLLFLQMPGTLLPLFFFPHETFRDVPFMPTLEGQYIIKNLVLMAAGLVVGATVRGGHLEPED